MYETIVLCGYSLIKGDINTFKKCRIIVHYMYKPIVLYWHRVINEDISVI